MKYTSTSPQQTKKIASDLVKELKGGSVVGLVGELGAGKTTFVQGVAEYFGIEDYVSSPTFTLINEYNIRKTAPNKLPAASCQLVHVDCYRLDNPQELIDIGLDEYLERNDVITVIEWADKVKDLLPPDTIWIEMNHGEEENERMINIMK